MRKVFLDNIPKRGKMFNWKESIGCKFKFIYDDIEGEMSIVGYDGKYLTIEHKEKEFRIFTGDLLYGKIGAIIGKTTKEFKIEIGDMFDDLIITDREYKNDINGRKRKWYKYTCNKCGWTEGWIEEGNLLNKKRCSCCKGLTNVPNINSIVAKEENHWMIPYFQGGYDEAKLYTPSSHNKVKFKCPDCGRVKEKQISVCNLYYNHSIGCGCSDGVSYPNKVLRYLIYQLKELYDIEYNFEYNIENRNYDGYIKYNGKDYLIEMDGSFHKQSKNKLCGRNEIENDIYKNKLALDNEYELIRIDCEESDIGFIKNNILNSELSKIFDLSSVNWLEIDKLSQKNIVKEVCEYWVNKKEEKNTADLANVFDLNRSTIIDYLKIGAIHKWCKYKPREESKKAIVKLSKQVEIFKDGESLGIFKSCHELERQSEELFGVRLIYSVISSVALGNKKSYKGFTFKYFY